MKMQILGRRVHYWLAIGVALPAIVIFGTGVLLQLKKNVAWVQPPERSGVGKAPTLSLDDVLRISRTVPVAAVTDWNDIQRVDVRPSKGILKVTTANRHEIQIDTQTAEVLQVAYRRSDMIESIHDGSWFHPSAKLWIFLPAGIVLFVMWVSGLYLYWLPIWVKWRRARAASAPGRAVGA